MTGRLSSPDISAVTGKRLSAGTRAGYAADWSLFTDWCSATGHTAMPADAATISAFTTDCPAAPATQRRRRTALQHHHRINGYQLPDDEPAAPAEPTRVPLDPGQVDLAMRLLPSTGWIGGLFGRRDRALLTVAARTQIPYRQIARLTVGQLHITGGVATITDQNGAAHLVQEDESPVLCGPCALVRWRRLLDITATTKTKMSEFLTQKAKDVSENSHHPCKAPQPIDPRTLEVSLFPPIDQWGHLAVQIRPLTPRSVSRLARQAETGLPAHRAVAVDEFTAVLDGPAQTPEITVPSVPAPRPVWDWAAANDKKRAAIAALAPLTDMLDDIDARIKELAARAKQLETRDGPFERTERECPSEPTDRGPAGLGWPAT